MVLEPVALATDVDGVEGCRHHHVEGQVLGLLLAGDESVDGTHVSAKDAIPGWPWTRASRSSSGSGTSARAPRSST